jgi:hypothetical protein
VSSLALAFAPCAYAVVATAFVFGVYHGVAGVVAVVRSLRR